MSTTTVTAGPLQDAVREILDAAGGSPAGSAVFDASGTAAAPPLATPAALVARADAADPLPQVPELEPVARIVLESAALVAIATASVHGAARLTRRRSIPRPLPGVESATADPFSQTLLGAAIVEVSGARALVRTAAREADAAAADGPVAAATVAELTARALSAFEVASRVALAQGERVWEVVGTSGSAREHGFADGWTAARALSARHPRPARRRDAARSYLRWVGSRVGEGTA